MDYKLLGKNIKEARKSLKMTQEQLAEQIDVSTVFISQKMARESQAWKRFIKSL